MVRLHFLPLLTVVSFSLVHCGGDTSADDDNQDTPPPAADCRGSLPERLSVSEGGLLELPAGATYEAVGGGAIRDEGGKVFLRAPFRSQVEGEPGVRLSCGQVLPLDLRPLAWSALAEWDKGAGAPAREYGSWWLDADEGGGLVVFGGFLYEPKQFTPTNDAWRFDFTSNTWAQLTGTDLPILAGARTAPIPGSRAVWHFGGARMKDNGAIETPSGLYRAEYDRSTLKLTKVENAAAPGSYTGALVYDAKRSRWLSLCGADADDAGVNCNVHAFAADGVMSKLETQGKRPAGRLGFHYALDEANDRFVMFGGDRGQRIDGETWELDLATDPPTWTRLFEEGQGATQRRNGAFAYDPIGRRLFVWGGTPDGAKSVPNLQVLTLDRGQEAWVDVEATDAHSRTSGLGLYDAARGRIVFGFGNDDLVYQDLWSLDIANAAP